MPMTEYDKILTEAERRQVVETVKAMLDKAAKMKPSPFSFFTYCDHCPGPRSERIKRPCICRPYEGDTICPSCWALEKEKELLDKLVKAKKPKLDLADFARI